MPPEAPRSPQWTPSGRGRTGEPPTPDWANLSGMLKQYLQYGARGSTTDAVTDALREGILEGVIPSGTWLREEDLAHALEVSRTPIRESLRRLADEHLVSRTANRGSVVEPMTLDEVYAIYLVREVLEGLSVFTVASHPPPGLLANLMEVQEQTAAALEAEDYVRANRLSLDFHRVIRGATGNVYLVQFLERIENMVRRSGVSPYAVAERKQMSLAEHTSIIEAIASGDPEAARQAMVEHMRRAREGRVRALMGQIGLTT